MLQVSEPCPGLSPHLRGNLRRRCRRRRGYGSIPAPAGKPSAILNLSSPCRVNPRTCGETANCVRITVDSRGLSPHLRGNRNPDSGLSVRRGSIPAPAGKPGPDAIFTSSIQVYPRTCGETSIVEVNMSEKSGLSPHLRGNLSFGFHSGLHFGSIPAPAGKPAGSRGCPGPAGVYPRTCGETAVVLARPKGSQGLSPHLRGNPRPFHLSDAFPGSIPAPAGKPWPGRPNRTAGWVYPRTCGET